MVELGKGKRTYLTMREPLPSEILNIFPFLTTTGGHKSSEPDVEYNCIAYAVGRQDDWWWPETVMGLGYWPEGIPRECTIECFVEMFSLFDYEVCEDASLEEGFEKVAIYIGQSGRPTHAARQLSNGTWVSKLGEIEDIVHNRLEGLQGKKYGNVGKILKRPIKKV